MLFIISSNDPQKINSTSSWVLNTWSTLSWAADKNLEDLIKLIDEEEQNLEENTDISWDLSDDIDTASWAVNQEDTVQNTEPEEDRRWFFSRLFWNDDTEDITAQQESSTWSELEDPEVSVNQWDEQDSDNAITEKSNISPNSNLIKGWSHNNTEIYRDQNTNLPGINIETEIWNTYEIWVEMLKLNNKSFTKTLELMNRGDVVRQITVENSFGCFQVEVLASGTKGYVCKKYLTEQSTIPSADTILQAEHDTTPWITDRETTKDTSIASIPPISTEIGSYYKIAIDNTSFFDVILERFTLQKWDVLRQNSLPDPKTWCVSMRVVWTTTGENDGEIVSICSPDMVVSI